MASTFYRLCADRNSSLSDIRRVGSHLYQSLLGPFRDQIIKEKDVLNLDIDSTLALLPFSALTTPSGDWFGSSTQVRILPAWWTLDPASSFEDDPVSSSVKMVAVSGFGDSFEGGNREATEVARLFQHSRVIEGSSTEPQTVLRYLQTAEIFHFSGHATTTSGAHLLLSSSSNTSNLTPSSFGSVSLPRCRIAVLAACNTTAADPDRIEQLPDLRNAILRSGAHIVVASNWDVDDQSTRSMMLTFYHHLLLGRSASQALQTAQQSVRSDREWQHPYFWASFETFTD
jgi:CHAT domain-containing protein